jgi:acetyltransferase-like isoleucine patch superfamily enzyme
MPPRAERMIAPSAVIHPGVYLGEGTVVEDFCILGAPVEQTEGVRETVIGANAIIRSSTVIYAGTSIGGGFRSGNNANIREGSVIGDDVSVGTQSVIEHHVTIGNGVRIHSCVFVPEYSILEDECWLGPHSVLTNARFPLSPGAKNSLAGPILERRAIVGANATVLPGVRVGAGSLVGAGSVVSRDVPPGVVVAGIPAEVIREIHY